MDAITRCESEGAKRWRLPKWTHVGGVSCIVKEHYHATVLERWWGLPAAALLGVRYETLEVLRS